MDKIKFLFIRNIKLIVCLLLFLILGAGVTYSASVYLYQSNEIGYDNSNGGLSSTNIQDALDELYNMQGNSNSDCKSGFEKQNVNSTMYNCVKSAGSLSQSVISILSPAISDDSILFNNISSNTNGKGLYYINSTKNDEYPIYYYRGAVTNNNVLFANICWKIVRTTETGGIKLVYNGNPSSGKCTNTIGTNTQINGESYEYSNGQNGNPDFVGYTYGSNNENSSIVKSTLDNWFADNMTDYIGYLEDTVWCNDRSIGSTSGSNINYGAYTRLTSSNGQPSLNCAQVNDRYTVNSSNGNGLLTYPVGLLTIDEVVYAGGVNDTRNDTFYLYTREAWWTMSPYYYKNGAKMFITSDDIDARDTSVEKAGIRPSISLKRGISLNGDGSSDNPYTVSF